MMFTRVPQSSAAGIAAAMLVALVAQAEPAPDMEEIVVTATRTEKLLRATPWSVSVLTKQQVLEQNASQLADVLGDLPGIYVSDAGQAGQKRIRIRGEDARRMALLIDGEEFLDHREVGVPLLVDTANIQRIEVVRGPASVLYGPRAMGGVINVITRQEHSAPFEANVGAGLDTATSGRRYSASFGGRQQALDWQMSYSSNDEGNRRTPAGRIENTAWQSHGYGAAVHRQAGDSRYGISFERFASSSGVYVAPEVRFTPPFLDFAIDIPVRDRDKLRLDYAYTPGMQRLESVRADAWRQGSDRTFNTHSVMALAPGLVADSTIDTVSELVSKGFNLQSDWHPAADHTLVAGYQYVRDQVDQDRTRAVAINAGAPRAELSTDRAMLATHAVYLQDDWAITPYLSLLAGARAYAVDGRLAASTRLSDLPRFSDHHSIASAALVYDFSALTTLRFDVAQGYIYPSLMNLAMGAFAGPRFVNPVASLAPETSVTTEMGLRHAGDIVDVDATLFHTRAHNYIDHVPCESADDCLSPADEIYRNVGEASTVGLELMLRVQADGFVPYASLTWLRRHKQYEGVDTWQSGVPRIAGRGGIKRRLGQDSSVDVYARFQSDADEATAGRHGTTVEHFAGFVTLNAAMHWQWREHYRLDMVLENITDKPYSVATENLPAPGRSLRAAFGVTF